jgi:glycosyltransferase involved in cell wall biosynthesis
MAPSAATRISGTVICCQEADRIADCLRSLSFCDEIIVVDSGSTDATRAIAEGLGARVVVNAPFPGFKAQRQFAIDQAAHDWVLCLDADERATPALQARLQSLRAQGLQGVAYEMPRLNHYLGRIVRHGLNWPDRKIRLLDRTKARIGGVDPHERVELPSGTAAARIAEPIEHLGYRDFRQHRRTADNYARTAAEALAAAGRRANLVDLLVRPPSVAVKSLVVKRGFLDGWRGFVMAGMAAWTDWLKYWRLLRISRARRSQAGGGR